MQAPADFVSRLDRIFEGRLRIRWSFQRHEWHIEYKVAPGQILNFPVQSNDDRAIRAKDGYAFILAIRNGDRMPCPKCGYEVKVPLFEIAEVVCEYCTLQGRDGRYPAAYFPLEGDRLITYLSRLDPTRTWREGIAKLADAANERILKQKERDFENHIEAATKENFTDLLNIQSVGYTGKVFTG
jgi:hypothetical protein